MEEFLKKCVNPGNIIEGTCSMCAFNSYLLLKGYDLKKPEVCGGGTDNFKLFGDWFYAKFINNEFATVYSINSNDLFRSISEFKGHIISHILTSESIENGPYLVSVNEGAHWFNLVKKEDDVEFIDCILCRGFTTYGSLNNTQIDVLSIPEDIIKEYFKDILPNITDTRIGGNRQKTKKRKTKKRKTKKRRS
jgi:hypothetical protein